MNKYEQKNVNLVESGEGQVEILLPDVCNEEFDQYDYLNVADESDQFITDSWKCRTYVGERSFIIGKGAGTTDR